jgi:2-polyprenyl-3-methyl-5-hydroxy-6-metoxy-1,4-benzoquinol methylase
MMTSNTPNVHNEAVRIVDAYKTLQPDNKPEYFRYHRYRFVSLLETVMHLPGKRVLEIGVNPGQFTEMLVQAGYTVSGTDLFPEHRADFWQRLNVDVRRWNIDNEDPPYQPEQFDIILFSEVIEHLAHPPLEALEAFYALLAPGGHLVISTPNQFYFKSRLRTFFDIILSRPFDHDEEFTRWALLRREARYYTHSRLFSMQQLAWLAQESHYTVTQQIYCSAYEPVGLERGRFTKAPHRWLAKAFIALITNLFPASRSMLLIVLQRPPK